MFVRLGFKNDTALQEYKRDKCKGWHLVERIEQLTDEETNSCPVCFDEVMVAPRAGKCGHAFCFPCLMCLICRECEPKSSVACPMCKKEIRKEELKRVRFQRIQNLETMKIVTLVLVKASAQLGYVDVMGLTNTSEVPPQSARDAAKCYSRLIVIEDIINETVSDYEQLDAYYKQALRNNENSLRISCILSCLQHTKRSMFNVSLKEDIHNIKMRKISLESRVGIHSLLVGSHLKTANESSSSSVILTKTVTDDKDTKADCRHDIVYPHNELKQFIYDHCPLAETPTVVERHNILQKKYYLREVETYVPVYQLIDGQHAILDEKCMQCIIMHAELTFSEKDNKTLIPTVIEDLNVTRVYKRTMDPRFRKEHPELIYIPIYSPIYFFEVDLSNIVAPEVIEAIYPELLNGRKPKPDFLPTPNCKTKKKLKSSRYSLIGGDYQVPASIHDTRMFPATLGEPTNVGASESSLENPIPLYRIALEHKKFDTDYPVLGMDIVSRDRHAGYNRRGNNRRH